MPNTAIWVLRTATGGMVQAHVIRFIPPFEPEEVSTPHLHDVDLQMIYVLKGWYKTEFEGEGEHTFHAGACWLQPPAIKHTVLGYSDDCELLGDRVAGGVQDGDAGKSNQTSFARNKHPVTTTKITAVLATTVAT